MKLMLAAVSTAGCAGGGYRYYASTPPPPLRLEGRGIEPGPGYLWIAGYWAYRGGNLPRRLMIEPNLGESSQKL